MTNLLFDHAKHLNLNFKISLAKYFVFVNVPPSIDDEIDTQSLVYAVINEVKVLDPAGSNFYSGFYQATGPIVFVDLNQVQCVIGRVLDRGKWAIIDRSTSVAQIYDTV